LRNLVDTLEVMGKEGSLNGLEMFLFTDNSTAEAAFFNGSSKSEKLFDLVLKVKTMEMTYNTCVHLCHVSGERMQVQGSDGLSRGNLNVGVMAGKNMLDFVPIHLNALERSYQLKEWIEEWTGKDQLEWLSPAGWFTRGHDLVEEKWNRNVDGMKMPVLEPGFFVWTPAPTAGEAAIEELRRARHKRQASHHLFVIPRLMQPQWRKQLYKAADLVITLPAGHPAWPVTMFEPLTLGFAFPFLKHSPWQLRRSEYIVELGRKLSGMWRDNLAGEGPLLRELWFVQRKLSNLPSELARKMLLSQQTFGFQNCFPRKRRRGQMAKDKGRAQVSKRKKR
jgi:hypothetical protein